MSEDWATWLPRLADAEVHAIFGADERAIRRYNLLAMLLHENRTVRDVCGRQGVTPATLRRLRAALQARGLAGLRSQPYCTAHRRPTRTPRAPGGGLRRAGYRRVAWGYRGSRSPSGRAPAPDLWAPALAPLIRLVLPLLADEPSSELGQSRLATHVFPTEGDHLRRGELLRALLLQALTALRPPHTDPYDPPARVYAILAHEIRPQTSCDVFQRRLGLTPTAYIHARRQALEQLADMLVLQGGHVGTTKEAPSP